MHGLLQVLLAIGIVVAIIGAVIGMALFGAWAQRDDPLHWRD